MAQNLDIQLLLKDAKTALMPVLRNIEGWEMASPERVNVHQISGAMTNLVYRCSYNTPSKKHHALARVFGSAGGLFGREDEQQVFSAVADAGLGPKVLALFPDGRIEEFIEAQSVSAELMAEPAVAVSIASAMAHFHFSMLKHFTTLDHLPSCMSPIAQLWDRLRDWVKIGRDLWTAEELAGHKLENITEEIDALQHLLTAEQPGWLGFCHNDLQYGNMLLAAHSTTPSAKSLLPAEDNLTQGLGREDGIGRDTVLGTSGDLDPMLANLLNEKLEGISPKAGGISKSPFWEERPSLGRNSMKKSTSMAKQPAAGTAADDELDQIDPTELLTSPGDDQDDPPAQADQLPYDSHPSTPDKKVAANAHIRLIDYEYAGVNPIAYDLANHWCEYAADYHTHTPHVLDYSKFPDKEHQAGFIHAYIETVVSMAKTHGDTLSWADGEVSYSAPAPGAMQIHTDTDCNQSLFSKDAISIPIQKRPAVGQGMFAEASSSAPPKNDAPGQGSYNSPSAPPFHKHSSVQKLKDAVIDNIKKVVGGSKPEDDSCEACKPGDKACADHVEPLLPELCRRQDSNDQIARIKQELHDAALAYVPISHLMWGLWGLIQAKTSNCDYDFIEYGSQRLEQYHKTKPDLRKQ